VTRVQANLLLLFVAAIWGAGFVAQTTAMDTIGPALFVGLRFMIASLVALPLAIIEHRKATTPLRRPHMLAFVFIGMALFGGCITQQYGLLTTTVTNSGFLTALYVVFVPVLSLLVFRRLPHWVIWPASLLSLAGIFLLNGARLDGLSSGDTLTIVCALFYAVQVLVIGMVVTTSGRPMLLCFVQFMVCTLLGLSLAFGSEPVEITSIVSAGQEIIFAGLLSSGLAFILQVVGQRFTTAPQAAIFLSTESLFAAIFGAVMLGESIGLIGYIGCALIFASLMLVELLPDWIKTKASPVQS
jgi:drug/metabolite transporter (DMT)-like permease